MDHYVASFGPNLSSPSASLTVRARLSPKQQSLARVTKVTGSQPAHLTPDKQQKWIGAGNH